MLETIDERKEVSEFDLNLVNLMDELIPLRNAIEYISNLCKEKNFVSIESLESRLNELEVKKNLRKIFPLNHYFIFYLKKRIRVYL